MVYPASPGTAYVLAVLHAWRLSNVREGSRAVGTYRKGMRQAVTGSGDRGPPATECESGRRRPRLERNMAPGSPARVSPESPGRGHVTPSLPPGLLQASCAEVRQASLLKVKVGQTVKERDVVLHPGHPSPGMEDALGERVVNKPRFLDNLGVHFPGGVGELHAPPPPYTFYSRFMSR